MTLKDAASAERAEAEAEARIGREQDRSRALVLRQLALSVAIEHARDKGDVKAVLDYAEAVHRWLSGETVH